MKLSLIVCQFPFHLRFAPASKFMMSLFSRDSTWCVQGIHDRTLCWALVNDSRLRLMPQQIPSRGTGKSAKRDWFFYQVRPVELCLVSRDSTLVMTGLVEPQFVARLPKRLQEQAEGK